MTIPQEQKIKFYRKKGSNRDLTFTESDGGAVTVRLVFPPMIVVLDVKGQVVETSCYKPGEVVLSAEEKMSDSDREIRSLLD